MNEKLRLTPERHDLITYYSLHLFSVEVHTNCSKIRRHNGKMSVHACNTREILRAQRNKNYIIFTMTLSWQNYDIFKIPIAYFQFAGISPSQNRYGYGFQESFCLNLLCYLSHSRKKNCVLYTALCRCFGLIDTAANRWHMFCYPIF